MTKLDIGCGLNLKGPLDQWTHLDLNAGPHVELVSDFGHIDLPDSSVDEIWLGDVIEHVPPWRLDEVFLEWKRVLTSNGRLTGTTPNLYKTLDDYAKGAITLQEALVPRLYGWADRPTEIHYVSYTEDTLATLLRRYGFGEPDYIASPGPIQLRWWLVFSARRQA